VEAMSEVEHQVSSSTHVIHVFDREGDITEVFDQVLKLKHTGVLVFAAHAPSLDPNSEHLWQKLDSQPLRYEQEIKVPETGKRKALIAKLVVRSAKVQLRVPYRFDNRDPSQVYAVYATEIDCLKGETPLEWMLLTTEIVEELETAMKILRWYTYRWRVEEFHKIFKSGRRV
jgi:Transposase DDE domain